MSNITKDTADITNKQCAACGNNEGEDDSLKACTACKLVKYCNRVCQIAYWPAHKTVCKKGVAELFGVKLFKQPLPVVNCVICFLRPPITEDHKQ